MPRFEIEHPPQETVEQRASRYERALKAIANVPPLVVGDEYAIWVQSVSEDVLQGHEAECPRCETAVHDGPCVGEEAETAEEGESGTAGRRGRKQHLKS